MPRPQLQKSKSHFTFFLRKPVRVIWVCSVSISRVTIFALHVAPNDWVMSESWGSVWKGTEILIFKNMIIDCQCLTNKNSGSRIESHVWVVGLQYQVSRDCHLVGRRRRVSRRKGKLRPLLVPLQTAQRNSGTGTTPKVEGQIMLWP